MGSVKGGLIPVDPQTLLYLTRTPDDEHFLKDPAFQAKTAHKMMAIFAKNNQG